MWVPRIEGGNEENDDDDEEEEEEEWEEKEIVNNTWNQLLPLSEITWTSLFCQYFFVC